LQINESVAHQQAEHLRKLRAERSNEEVARRLTLLRKAASGAENLMPYLYDAVKAYATLGEISDAMREVFGVYNEVSVT
jgi:methylmalonyl-CoA mutase N-terminal domain/subunit